MTRGDSGKRANIRKRSFRFQLVSCLLISLFFAPIQVNSGPLKPCVVVAYAVGNTYIQSPTYSQYLEFVGGAVSFTNCAVAPTTATIVIANPPQNPPPTAPVYIMLSTAAAGTMSSQVLVTQGSQIVINNSLGNSDWFSGTTWAGVTLFSPGTPYVPASVTVIWQ